MRHKIFIICILVIILLSFSLISCGKQINTTTTIKVAEETTKYPDLIKLTLDGERKGSDIIFYGTTNLPDGVLLAYQLTIPEQEVYSYLGEEGNLIIKDGKFSGKASNVPEGKAEIWVAFQTILGTGVEDKQPQGVIDKYGELGEKMKGDNVVKSGYMKRIELIINR